jgi:hypothetical protein
MVLNGDIRAYLTRFRIQVRYSMGTINAFSSVSLVPFVRVSDYANAFYPIALTRPVAHRVSTSETFPVTASQFYHLVTKTKSSVSLLRS